MAATSTTTTTSTPIIQSVQLKGHQAAVTCLDHSSSSSVGPSLLLSGSEDGTCRLWDLRIGRTVSCIQCSNNKHSNNSGTAAEGSQPEVLSVAFGPSWTTTVVLDQQPQQPSSFTAASPFAHDFSVYASVGKCVWGYDLRQASSPIITQPSIDLSDLLDAPDDVNQIAFSPSLSCRSTNTTRLAHATSPCGGSSHNKTKKRGGRKSSSFHAPIHMAVVDDGGSVRVTADWALRTGDNNTNTNKRVFCHGHDAMVTSLAYAPRNNNYSSNNNNTNRNRQQYLASGGTDCCIRIWDLQQPNKPVASIALSHTDAGANQVCNPPMVHCLNYSPSGRLLAAGLGDGSIAIVQGPVVTARLDEAHTGSVASCLFPAWANHNNNNSAIAAHDRLLCSIGNDGCIVLWDLGLSLAGNQATNPALFLPHTTTTHGTSSMEEQLSHMTLHHNNNNNCTDELLLDPPKTLFAFQHTTGSKPNWMVSGRAHDPVFPSSLFVADTTNDITIYTIPLQ